MKIIHPQFLVAAFGALGRAAPDLQRRQA
jgi:hypothetical protein